MYGQQYPQQQNYNYPQQSYANPNQSMIPVNPGVALLGQVGQNTIAMNQNAYAAQTQFNMGQSAPYGMQQQQPFGMQSGFGHQPQMQQQQQQMGGQNWAGYQMQRY